MSDLTVPRFAGERLAQFVAASRWGELPSEVRHEGKRSLLNFIGCALGVAACSRRSRWRCACCCRLLRRRPRHRARPYWSGSIRLARRSSMPSAATCSTTTTRTCAQSSIPSAPVAPAALALARATRPVRRRRCCTPSSWAAEVECRIGNAVSPGSLCSRLAHHLYLRRVRLRRGQREAAGPGCRRRPAHALGIAASQLV